MIIRPAEPPDWEPIGGICAEVVADGTTYAYATAADMAASWQTAPWAWVATEPSGSVVGAYVLRPNQPGRGRHVVNASYVVAAAARGRGIGRALGEHSLTAARELGFRAMQFNLVVATNAGAIALWRKLGFEIVGTLPGAFEHARQGFVAAHVMYRALVAEHR